MASNRLIVRVDVSGDGGRTWQQAVLEETSCDPWAWTFWTATIDLTLGEHELAVRAWDDAGQTRPALSEDTWNFKGYLSAAWHRISVVVAQRVIAPILARRDAPALWLAVVVTDVGTRFGAAALTGLLQLVQHTAWPGAGIALLNAASNALFSDTTNCSPH